MPYISLPTSVMLKTSVIKFVSGERKQKGLLITGRAVHRKGCSSRPLGLAGQLHVSLLKRVFERDSYKHFQKHTKETYFLL